MRIQTNQVQVYWLILLDGGTHWSLLVYHKDSWYYFDSASSEGQMIINLATIMQNIKIIIKKGKQKMHQIEHSHHLHHHQHFLKHYDMGWGLDAMKNAMNQSMKIECAEDTPKQTNLYDCGIYVISFAEAIVQLYIGKEGKINDLKEESMNMFLHIEPQFIHDKRTEIACLLKDMIKQSKNNSQQQMQSCNNHGQEIIVQNQNWNNIKQQIHKQQEI